MHSGRETQWRTQRESLNAHRQNDRDPDGRSPVNTAALETHSTPNTQHFYMKKTMMQLINHETGHSSGAVNENYSRKYLMKQDEAKI